MWWEGEWTLTLSPHMQSRQEPHKPQLTSDLSPPWWTIMIPMTVSACWINLFPKPLVSEWSSFEVHTRYFQKCYPHSLRRRIYFKILPTSDSHNAARVTTDYSPGEHWAFRRAHPIWLNQGRLAEKEGCWAASNNSQGCKDPGLCLGWVTSQGVTQDMLSSHCLLHLEVCDMRTRAAESRGVGTAF